MIQPKAHGFFLGKGVKRICIENFQLLFDHFIVGCPKFLEHVMIRDFITKSPTLELAIEKFVNFSQKIPIITKLSFSIYSDSLCNFLLHGDH